MLRLLLLLFTTLSAAQQVNVYFDFNKSNLNLQAVEALNVFLAANKDVMITELVGYCDHVGDTIYNDALALKRVDSVEAFLKSKAIKLSDKLIKKAIGERTVQLVEQGANRRVSIGYVGIERSKPTTDASLRQMIGNAKVGDLIALSSMKFFNNSARMLPKSIPILEELVCVLQENPMLEIEIQGHICCQLKEDYGKISTARARAVYNYLLRNKISRKRLSYKGFGISRPIFKIPEKNAEEEEENRRVEIKIVKK